MTHKLCSYCGGSGFTTEEQLKYECEWCDGSGFEPEDMTKADWEDFLDEVKEGR